MKTLFRYFLQGLIYVVPIGVTLYLIVETLVFLDNLIPFSMPGLGIIILFFAIALLGLVGNFLVSLPLFSFLESLLDRAPLVKMIFTSVRDLTSSFMGKKKGFNRPVLVKVYDNSAIQRMGFITDEDISQLGLEENLITVYVPHSYAISGQMFIVPPHYVTPLEVSPGEAMKYMVSGGVSQLAEERENKNSHQ